MAIWQGLFFVWDNNAGKTDKNDRKQYTSIKIYYNFKQFYIANFLTMCYAET